MSLQQQIQFQAQTFNNRIEFVQVVRLLNKQDSWKPERLCNDLNIYISNYGLTAGFNKANRMFLVKDIGGKVMFTSTGDVGEHLFKLMIQKLNCR